MAYLTSSCIRGQSILVGALSLAMFCHPGVGVRSYTGSAALTLHQGFSSLEASSYMLGFVGGYAHRVSKWPVLS
ncbi:hypothetical protein F5Y12DRAFT_742516 [Xylaria sp. FL1777]|nr:hypothetical protein F5Y12DRAFT_742516 [Xylaria sp. FL1777]